MAVGIDLKDVSKTYETSKSTPILALTNTDLTLRPGEFFSLVGPSGCGKSTLLNMIAGLLPTSTGDIHIGSDKIVKPQRSTGIVFQHATLLRWLTVLENVLLPSKIAGTLDSKTRALAEQYLELVGLGHTKHRYPPELSGGMQQRAAIVRSLVSNPGVLLMDEPFSALDEFTRETLQDELMRLWTDQPKTVVFVTHNIAEAVYLSDRVGIMSARPGKLEAVVDIPLDRPRLPELRSQSHFYEIVGDIRRQIDPGNSK
ncbi:ABC transporter ATP-binding protein [Paeniglutamicibacter sp. MACA_103]|uniref:ABC transporter ATP-binding protein n=1 Tax=Paeniglutamicibacter sp. MACA_103 TaxID=3377337 RepID=UPI003896268C